MCVVLYFHRAMENSHFLFPFFLFHSSFVILHQIMSWMESAFLFLFLCSSLSVILLLSPLYLCLSPPCLFLSFPVSLSISFPTLCPSILFYWIPLGTSWRWPDRWISFRMERGGSSENCTQDPRKFVDVYWPNSWRIRIQHVLFIILCLREHVCTHVGWFIPWHRVSYTFCVHSEPIYFYYHLYYHYHLYCHSYSYNIFYFCIHSLYRIYLGGIYWDICYRWAPSLPLLYLSSPQGEIRNF